MLQGCDAILEPVLLYGKDENGTKNNQEDFSVNITPLTFLSAKKANLDPYSRKLMSLGTGSEANILNESDLKYFDIPRDIKKTEYLIGIGDRLSLIIQNKFLNDTPKWPKNSNQTEYILGAGDILTFVQQNDISNREFNDNIGTTSYVKTETIISTEGTVGTNGNILLLGVGNINAGNRPLNDVRTEVRNILIRDGLAPNFQIEITGFKSKKAFLTSSGKNKKIPINNIPITLREIVIEAGIAQSLEDLAVISLTRKSEIYHYTAKQLLEPSAPDIVIQNQDYIDIKLISDQPTNIQSTVDAQGFILIPSIGKIKAKGKTLAELQKKISILQADNKLDATIHLEIIEFNSKKAYLVLENKSMSIPLTDKIISIRELILGSNSTNTSNSGFVLITLIRDGKKYQLMENQILNPKEQDIWVQDKDQIIVTNYNYKPGQVFALSGYNSAKIITINPSVRETLADILFVPEGALNNQYSKRSEVYLLRGRNPSTAFHLDAQNVSRLLVAAKTELRPNDIIYVAERPIISFARTMNEISPLRTLIRDIQNDNIP